MKIRYRLLASCFGLVFAAFDASAQSDNAQVSGFVKDPSGAVIAAASVAVVNEATGLERRAATGETGYFTVSALPPGYYHHGGGARLQTLRQDPQ